MRAGFSLTLGSDGVLEKACEAVGALATGAGRVQERLSEAANHLALIGRNELPSEELRLMLVDIVDALASAQLSDPLEDLGDEDAVEIARRILDLHLRLQRALRVPDEDAAIQRGVADTVTRKARVMIRCPATGRAIATGLTVDPKTWNARGLNRVTCPECKRVHLWRRSEGYLEGGIGL